MDDGQIHKRPLPGGLLALDPRACESPPSTTTWQPLTSIIPPNGLVSAGSYQTQQTAPAASRILRELRTMAMNKNALRAYFGTKVGCFVYQATVHQLYADLEMSITVTLQNLANLVRHTVRCAQKYLMTPYSNGYEVRPFSCRMKILRPEMRLYELQSNLHT
ncbi:unnamed protein product [Parnassius apollo]|uniref:(apollo) hypothetical protein n=1 Tax=Parnassius apollo TaxID=110799 RepID=A0A8S3XS85_PARAO|nr:unnamed protein product [Parnassius apollo]